MTVRAHRAATRTLPRGRAGRHVPTLVVLAAVASVVATYRRASAAPAVGASNGSAQPSTRRPAHEPPRGSAVPPSPAPGGFVLDGGPVLSPGARGAAVGAPTRPARGRRGGCRRRGVIAG